MRPEREPHAQKAKEPDERSEHDRAGAEYDGRCEKPAQAKGETSAGRQDAAKVKEQPHTLDER